METACGDEKTYIGACEPDWKSRFNNHNSSFRHRHLEHKTTLAQYIWKLKDNGIQYKIRWKIIKQVRGYSKEAKKCYLCLTEKMMIVFGDKKRLINKRNEIMNYCKHRKKHTLAKVT